MNALLRWKRDSQACHYISCAASVLGISWSDNVINDTIIGLMRKTNTRSKTDK